LTPRPGGPEGGHPRAADEENPASGWEPIRAPEGMESAYRMSFILLKNKEFFD
jgi:hypothetical protein